MAEIKINPESAAQSTSTAVTSAPPAPNAAPQSAASTVSTPPPVLEIDTEPQAGNIFNQTTTKTEGPKLIDSIVGLNSEAASKMKPILGSSGAQLQQTLDQEREYRQKKQLRLVQFIFSGVLITSLLLAFYLYSELSPNFNLFGANTTARLADVNKSIRGLQTAINKNRYLNAQLDLNRFSYQSALFMDSVAKLNDQNTSAAMIKDLNATITSTKEQLPVLLKSIKDNLGAEIVVTTFRSQAEPEKTADEIRTQFETDMRDALLQEKKAKMSESGSSHDLKLYDNTIKLVGNRALLTVINGTQVDDLEKKMADYAEKPNQENKQAVQKLFSGILASTRSDIATIGALKNMRINWSSVIKNIETVTVQADSNFGNGLFDTLGGIQYTGYEFDSKTNKIIISGNTKTLDATNFSLLSELIDKIENSAYFTGVDMRSFNKTGDSSTGYTASFKIAFSLKAPDDNSKAKTLTLGKQAIIEKAKLRRISENQIIKTNN